MSVPSWLRCLTTRLTGRTAPRGLPTRPARRPAVRPRLVALEDRTTPSATLIADLNAVTAKLSNLSDFRQVGLWTYFVADDPNHGRELWRTDGTGAGTDLVSESLPGPASQSLSQFTVLGSRLFFVANDGSDEAVLWYTDGATGLTDRVTGGGSALSSAAELTVVGSTLYFAATDGSTGRELWSIGAAANSASLVRDINENSGAGSDPSMLTFAPATNTLYFTADDGNFGRELWKLNVNDGQSNRVSDIPNGSPGANITSLTVAGSYAYFQVDTTSSAVWVTNATATDAQRVSFFFFQLDSLHSFTPSGNNVYFVRGGTLFRATPTATASLGSMQPENLIAFNDKLFFSATDAANGRELWSTDGTTTALHANLNPNNSGSSNPRQFQRADDRLYFVADDPWGSQLWLVTAAGTVPTKLSRSDGQTAFSSPDSLTAVGDSVFFLTDGPAGRELWRTNWTAAEAVGDAEDRPPRDAGRPHGAGTDVYFEANGLWRFDGSDLGEVVVPTSKIGTDSANVALVVAGSRVYVGFDDGTDFHLWATNDSLTGFVAVASINDPGSFSMTAVGDDLYFTDLDPTEGLVLRRTRGTLETTAVVAGHLVDSGLIIAGTTAYFRVDDQGTEVDLWKTDATGATVMVVDGLPAGATSFVTATPNVLYFMAPGSNGYDLWSSTAAGTQPLRGGFSPESVFGRGFALTPAGSGVFFLNDRYPVLELWRSDGTVEGTLPVTALTAEIESESHVGRIAAVGSSVVFEAGQIIGSGWWIANRSGAYRPLPNGPGSFGGEVSLTELATENADSDLQQLDGVGVAGSNLIFFANDGVHGRELWSVPVTVPSAPVVTASGDVTIDEGSTYVHTGSFTDPDSGESWTADLDFGNPITLYGNNFSFTNTYADQGVTVTHVRVTDSRGFVDFGEYYVTVNNVAPSVSINGLSAGAVGQSVVLTLAATDPGADDVAAGFTYVIDWGDGTDPETVGPDAVLTVNHTYAAAGVYSIAATATDKDGGVSQAVTALVVAGRGDATNTISLAAGTSAGQYVVTLNGSPQTVQPAGPVFVVGGGASDTVTVTAAPAGGVVIDGQGGADIYTVTFGGLLGTVNFADTGTAGTDVLTINGTPEDETFNKQSEFVKRKLTGEADYSQMVEFDGIEGLITLNMRAGNDIANDPNSGNFLILGGDGNDTIVIRDTVGPGVTADGGAGSDTYVIDAGNLQGPVAITDTGTAGTDNVTVQGTAAADTITQSGNQVVANGGTITLGGVDALAVDGGGGTDDFTVVTPPTVPTTVTGVADTVIDGTATADTIRLTAGSNPGEVRVRVNGVLIGTYRPTGRMIVHGGAGNDDIDVATAVATPVWVYGGAGDDEVHAGGGGDHLFGEAGNDKLFARVGDDELDGGDGNDELRAGTGSDVARGGDGCDELWGGTGNDRLYGDAGNDILRGGGGCDRLDGGDGDDELRAGTGGDTLLGGCGNDTLKGGQGGDWMDGGAGNDRLDGQGGNDVMLGGTGDDLLMGGAGQDMIVGGAGADRIEGNADEDILIAGTTLYDDNAAALSAIFAEWTSGNSYATRVANITGGTGLTQGFRLWGADGANQTVFSDNDRDVLAGGAGIDWFFANLNGGGTLDSISDLRANELWTDTDF